MLEENFNSWVLHSAANAGVTAVQYSGIAAGGANAYNNIAVQNMSSSGSGLRVNAREVIFAGGEIIHIML